MCFGLECGTLVTSREDHREIKHHLLPLLVFLFNTQSHMQKWRRLLPSSFAPGPALFPRRWMISAVASWSSGGWVIFSWGPQLYSCGTAKLGCATPTPVTRTASVPTYRVTKATREGRAWKSFFCHPQSGELDAWGSHMTRQELVLRGGFCWNVLHQIKNRPLVWVYVHCGYNNILPWFTTDKT